MSKNNIKNTEVRYIKLNADDGIGDIFESYAYKTEKEFIDDYTENLRCDSSIAEILSGSKLLKVTIEEVGEIDVELKIKK